jgi:hypothetical protein
MEAFQAVGDMLGMQRQLEGADGDREDKGNRRDRAATA